MPTPIEVGQYALAAAIAIVLIGLASAVSIAMIRGALGLNKTDDPTEEPK